jgi:uncharacterized surface protein with fasciclin (FAS1) repeats
MTSFRLLTAAATLALAAGSAWAQTPPPAQTQAKTQAQAQQATGRPTTDAPASTAVQGTAAAVSQGVAGAPAAAPAAAPYRAIAPAGDIIQTLQASGQFKSFIKALDATNLTPVLKSQPHLTVFAPTDAAFAAYGDINSLTAQANLPALQKLLLHHIINAEVDSSKFKGAHGPVASGAGDKVVLDGTTPTLKADQANILQADVHATNGFVDVVDQVLKAGSVPETLPDQAAPAGDAAAAAAPAQPPAAAAEPEKTEKATTSKKKATRKK